MSNDRGVIGRRDYASQIRDFSGLRYGNITPTDIDGLIDFHNAAWIIFELKHAGAELPFGQRLALERQVDDLDASGKLSIVLVAEHRDTPPQDINAADAIVIQYRVNGEWHKYSGGKSLRQAIDGFLKSNGLI
jgi:translation initiation factor RLI1